ncbi:MAG: DUF7093 family protein [Halobacteriota archaeon]|uniref:DUF7093 family protein n=1 Tax=Natronomonas sp. TaxID=2184060 RepID=UPI0039753472
MGLRCSILGHAFEDAGVEREREEQGSEVVTTEREIERCRHCGAERVVSENTEVAAVVDASDVGIDTDERDVVADSDADRDGMGAGGGLAGAVERSGVENEVGAADAQATEPTDEVSSGTASGATDGDLGPDEGETVDEALSDLDADDEVPPDPEEEDAEILTDDDEPERQPGQWPDDLDGSDAGDDAPLDPDEESLSGLTVPEGRIVCPDCSFSIEANSGYREGDPCPECNAWLEAERNQ